MAKTENKFLEYIYENFYDRIHKSVLNFVISHKEEELVNTPCGAYGFFDLDVTDMDFANVYIEEKENNRINFDIVVEPTIEYQYNYYEKRHREVDGDSCNGRWITIQCTGIIGDKLKEFAIIAPPSEYNKARLTKPLNGDLVPYISRGNYEKKAEEILLRAYGPDYRLMDSVDAFDLAKKLGLQVMERRINKEGTAFGEVFFKDCEVELYDEETDSYRKELIKAKTIVVDDKTTSIMSFGSENITVAHECVHYALHEKAFLFAQMVNKDLKYIQCETSCSIKNLGTGDRESWMEIQANAIAPILLMPKNSVLKVFNTLLKERDIFSYGFGCLNSINGIIQYLAKYFGVTNYAMRKRLVDLGVSFARGALNYVDGSYVPAFEYKENSLKEGQTFVISKEEAAINISISSVANRQKEINRFVFVENHVCINDEKYVCSSGDSLRLTPYGRNHVDECCLVFNLETRINSSPSKNKLYTFCYLCRGIDINGLTYQCSLDQSSSRNALDNAKKLKNQQDLVIKLSSIAIMTRSEALKFLMKEMKVSEAELADDLKVEPKTVQRYRNNDNKTISKDTLVAICVSLKLPPEISHIFIEKCCTSGFNFKNKRDFALNSVIQGFYASGIKNANDILKSMEQEPLVIDDEE